MFDFIKRLLGVPAQVPPPVRKPRKRPEPQGDTVPSALPEVIEGNDETDWNLWKDSVDSQVQALNSRAAPLKSGPARTAYDERDPFSRVGKNSG